MSNILLAFKNIVNNYQLKIKNPIKGSNRANLMGEGLEEFIKDMFASSINETDKIKRLEAHSKTYSYIGNKNNPPDLILKNSDAIEIKKLESYNAAIALNSSYPKNKLYSASPMLTKACKQCEDGWIEKDMIYAIGYIPSKSVHLKSLWLVYGDCFCADKETYEKIKQVISNGVLSVQNVEFTETKELGKVKKVDPLGVTDLRIRGMWSIDNPTKIFNYIYEYDREKDFQLICLMREEKYNSIISKTDKEILEILNNKDIKIKDIKIKNPNNPAKLVNGKLLLFSI